MTKEILALNEQPNLPRSLPEKDLAKATNWTPEDWMVFFLDWSSRSQCQYEKLQDSNDFLVAAARKSEEDRARAEESQLEALSKLKFLEAEQELVKSDRLRKQAQRDKRLKRRIAPVRETISQEELKTILSWVPQNSGYSNARVRLALVLLSITGLRVANLLVLTVRHIRELLDEGETNISLIKRGSKRHCLKISSAGQALLRGEKRTIEELRKDKTLTSPIFSPVRNPSLSISRVKLTVDLNRLLSRASVELGRHLRSHSFRATLITNLLVDNPVHLVQKHIGHQNVHSTLLYNRRALSPEEQATMLDRLDAASRPGEPLT